MGQQFPSLERSEIQEPPRPPDVGREFKLYWYTWAAVLLFGSIVVLALLGFFGETRGATMVSGRTLELRIDYPERFRYKEINPIRVWVTNTSAATLDTVTVSFDTTYISRFSNVSFTPPAGRAFDISVLDLHPGEVRLVVAGLQGERYGRHAGTISASAGADTVEAVVQTLIFP